MKENIFDETFRNTARAVFRPAPPPSSDTVRVADLFCGRGELSLAAQTVDLSVVYAEEPTAKARREYASAVGLTPSNLVQNIDFDDVPPFDVLTASLPNSARGQERVFSRVLRFLRIRRPEIFLLVGGKQANSERFLNIIQDKTWRLGYRIGGNEDFGIEGDYVYVIGSLRPIASQVPSGVVRITNGVSERVPELQVVIGWLAQHLATESR